MSKFCVSCGSELDENTKFCNNCGKAVEDTNQVINNVVNETSKTVEANPISNSEERKTDGLAIASFVVSLVGLLIAGLWCGIISLCLGIPALRRIKAFNKKGKGLAIAGIAIGGFDIVAVLLYAALAVATVSSIF